MASLFSLLRLRSFDTGTRQGRSRQVPLRGHALDPERRGTEPLAIDAQVGRPVVLDAAGTADPDGDTVRFAWFFYPEAGSGIPGPPVFTRPPVGAGGGGPGEGGTPSAPAGGPPDVPARVTIENATGSRAHVVPKVAGIAHIILAVEDNGVPPLTSYRRIVLHVKSAPRAAPREGRRRARADRPRTRRPVVGASGDAAVIFRELKRI